MSAGALEALDRVLDRGGDADEVLRGVVRVLVERGGCSWAGVRFVEDGELVPGPEAGEPEPARRREVPVVYEGATVGALAVDGGPDEAFLERVALLIGAHVLLGWDTGGEPWEP